MNQENKIDLSVIHDPLFFLFVNPTRGPPDLPPTPPVQPSSKFYHRKPKCSKKVCMGRLNIAQKPVCLSGTHLMAFGREYVYKQIMKFRVYIERNILSNFLVLCIMEILLYITKSKSLITR